jgi:acyl-CoA synthetase (AMP-forming)/AMP-acid ligase II
MIYEQLDFVPLAWATHRLGGVQTPANAAYSAAEVAYQLKDSGAKCLFTCLPLLDTALQAAEKVGIPRNRIYIMALPDIATGGMTNTEFKTVDQLIEEGSKQPRLEELQWSKGEGARRCAFLCYSSGTSGLPVRIISTQFEIRTNAYLRKESLSRIKTSLPIHCKSASLTNYHEMP